MFPITSYAVIMYAAILHIIEGIAVLSTSDADGTVGMAALLNAIPDRCFLAAALFSSAAAALVVLVRELSHKPSIPILLAIIMLAPQQALLITTGLGAWLAVWHGSYADGVLRPSIFITTDQLPRGMFSMIHLTAMYGIASFAAARSK